MPTIYITSAKARYPVKDTSQTGLVFLKDCLHIENDSVFNLLVDVSKIDCVWFAPDDEIVNLFQQKPGVNILVNLSWVNFARIRLGKLFLLFNLKKYIRVYSKAPSKPPVHTIRCEL